MAAEEQADLNRRSLALRVAADVASEAVANAAAPQLAARAEPQGLELAERAARSEHAAEQAQQAAEDAEPAAERPEPAAQDAKVAADDDFQPDWGTEPAAAAHAVPQAGALPAAAEAGNGSPVPQSGVMPAAAGAAQRADEDAEQGQGKGWQRDDRMEEPDGNDWKQEHTQKGWQGQQEWAQQQGDSETRNNGWDDWTRPSPVQTGEGSAAAASQGSRQERAQQLRQGNYYNTSAVAAQLADRYSEHRPTLEAGGFDASAIRARGLYASSCMLRDIDHIAQVLWFLSNLHHDLVPKILLEPQLR